MGPSALFPPPPPFPQYLANLQPLLLQAVPPHPDQKGPGPHPHPPSSPLRSATPATTRAGPGAVHAVPRCDSLLVPPESPPRPRPAASRSGTQSQAVAAAKNCPRFWLHRPGPGASRCVRKGRRFLERGGAWGLSRSLGPGRAGDPRRTAPAGEESRGGGQRRCGPVGGAKRHGPAPRPPGVGPARPQQ